MASIIRARERLPLIGRISAVGTVAGAARRTIDATGKSRACLEKLHLCAQKYPRMRGLIIRKTRESLSEAALVTYEDKVLPERSPIAEGPRRNFRQVYTYPNGSQIVVGGLDKPGKVMSTEYDMIYVQEAVELDLVDWLALTTRLRNNVMPYQQLIADCNPDAPTLIRAARELGFQGTLSTETAQDIKILNEVAGDTANGFISVGGASTPEIRSAYMEEFAKEYAKVAGEWNDEAGTKVYALEIILATLQKAGKGAIDDVEAFKQAIPAFEMTNPFLKDEAKLTYVGTVDFGQKRQIGVPMVVNEVQDGQFKTLFVGSVE